MTKNSRFILITIGAIVLSAVLLLAISHRDNTTLAQSEVSSMKVKLEQLRDEILAGNIMLGFQFIEPISEGDNYWLFGDPNDERILTIEEIGDDYFCFSQRSEQAVLIRCVPFTNIASFDYLGN